MSTDSWGVSGLATFVPTSHAEVYDAIDPTKFKLPEPFVVCVVGASRGIGAGIAAAYAKANATALVLASRRTSGLNETATACREINPNIEVEIVSCDVTSASDVERLAKSTKAKFGRLDVVVVNSGYHGPLSLKITETDPETFAYASNVNYIGTFHCAKYLLPLLLDGAPSESGATKNFIAVSSIGAGIIRGPIANAQYCVSKAAQLKLIEHIHEQNQGIGVYAVNPGAVRTEMSDASAPEVFKQYLTDSRELCGAFCVWLSTQGNEARWLQGRLLNAKWDVQELEARRQEIEQKDLLKMRIAD